MYKRSEQGWLKHLDFILLDVLSAQLAFVLGYAWRFGFHTLVYDEAIQAERRGVRSAQYLQYPVGECHAKCCYELMNSFFLIYSG